MITKPGQHPGCILYSYSRDGEKREGKRQVKYVSTGYAVEDTLNELMLWPSLKESLSLSVYKASLDVEFPEQRNTKLNWCEANSMTLTFECFFFVHPKMNGPAGHLQWEYVNWSSSLSWQTASHKVKKIHIMKTEEGFKFSFGVACEVATLSQCPSPPRSLNAPPPPHSLWISPLTALSLCLSPPLSLYVYNIHVCKHL